MTLATTQRQLILSTADIADQQALLQQLVQQPNMLVIGYNSALVNSAQLRNCTTTQLPAVVNDGDNYDSSEVTTHQHSHLSQNFVRREQIMELGGISGRLRNS